MRGFKLETHPHPGDARRFLRVMPSIEVSLDQWPVVFTKFDGDQSVKDIDDFMTMMDGVLARKQLFVTINWMKRYTRSRDSMHRMGEWIKQTESATSAYAVAMTMVNASVGFRFLLSTVFLVRPLPVPYTVTPTLEGAFAFCRSQAERRGLALPAELRKPWADMP